MKLEGDGDRTLRMHDGWIELEVGVLDAKRSAAAAEGRPFEWAEHALQAPASGDGVLRPGNAVARQHCRERTVARRIGRGAAFPHRQFAEARLSQREIGCDRQRQRLRAVLRIAAVNFANTDQGLQSQDDMRVAFSDLFLHGKADMMKPVDALALFYDFLELTPIGADGDEMIRKLADRLVSVDLLAPAAELLQHQVDNRLEGVAKAEVATKLALIYLMDHKAAEALKAIRDTGQTGLPDNLTTQRRLLEARALAGTKQFEQALDMLADDDTPNVKEFRADEIGRAHV